MIIRHAEISVCLQNPRSWVAQKINPTPSFIRTGYAGATKLAIYRFHTTGDVRIARRHLRGLFPRLGLTNQSLIDEALDDLDNYMDWYVRESPVVATWRHRLRFDMGLGCFLGGEVSRIDVEPSNDRYRAIILGDTPNNWLSEIRFPLIQRALSEQLKRKDNLISVGFQRLDGSNIVLRSFSKQVLDNAENRARELANSVTKEWRRQAGRNR